MAHSLSPDCTPLKIAYDSCFNAWFEGYLQPLAASSSGQVTAEQRQEKSRIKAEEYQTRCGKVWESYRDCVQKAVRDSGLTPMLQEARKENPLDLSEVSPSSSSPSSSASSGSSIRRPK